MTEGNKAIHGYKVFNPDWTCSPCRNTKQYTCPGKFEEDGELDVCGHGMHFCRNAADCFNYYNFDPKNHVAEVIAYGDVMGYGDKCCTNKLEIVREIPWQEVLEIVNVGKNCTGLWNSGDWNSGNWNSGNWNSGNWNSGNFSNGCFNTEEPKIWLFNKPSEWTYRDWYNSKARYILNHIPKNVVEWVYSSNMTDGEKAEHPTHETTGGYLKVLDESDCGQLWWGRLTDGEKSIIKALSNFDSEIFEQCTGVRVDG